jgi:hypothetical protein
MNTNHAYVAGLIDGEGCIHLDVTGGVYSPRVTVGMTYPALHLLEALKAEWGGTLYQMRRATATWAAAWTWHLTGYRAMNLLITIRPYLRLKTVQAECAIQVGMIREALPKRANGQAKWTPEARAACAAIKARMHAMNAKGPRAAVTSAEVA